MKRIIYLWIVLICLTFCLYRPDMLQAASGTAKSTKTTKSLITPNKSASQPSVGKAPGVKSKALAKIKPDLVVSKVWVDKDCLLNVEIGNAGKGSIPTAAHRNGKLTLTIGKNATHFFFTRSMPKRPAVDLRGKLKRPGTTLKFNTRMVLMKPANVTALVDSDKAIDESNEKNNRKSIQLKTGKCKPKKPATKQKSLATPSKAKKLARTRVTAQPTMRATATSLARIIDAHGVDFNRSPMSLNDGIGIDAIDDVTSYSFILRYGVDSSLANGDITFYMMRGLEPVAQTTRPFTHGGGDASGRVFVSQNFSWSIPVDLVNDDNYGIIAVKSDGLGISAPFTVNLPYRAHATGMGMSIEFTHPDSTYLLHGQEIHFRIACTCGSSIDRVHLQLVPATGGGAAAYDFSILDTGGAFTSSNQTWIIPAHIPRGDYRLLAQAGVSHCTGIENPSAYSRVFSINPPPEEPATGDRNTISIRSPLAGDTIYTGDHSQLWVQWSCVDCDEPDDLSYTRILLKNGTELQRIGPTHAGGDMSPMEWFNIFGYLSGADYQVRIELNRYNYDTESPEMISSQTTGNFSIINNSTSYLSDTNPVLLRTPSGFGGASFAVGSTLEIMWSHSPQRSTGHHLRLTLTRDSTDGGGEWPIVDSIPSYPYTYEWVIPDDVPPGSGYRVLVERVDGAGSSNSYLPFSITPRP